MNIIQYEPSTPAIPSHLKHSNRRQILQAFLNGGALSAGDISASTGLSRQTVAKSIRFFQSSGLLTSLGKGASTEMGGKRPELFSLARDRFFLCISLWPNWLDICLYTLGGEVAGSLLLAMTVSSDPREAVDISCELAEQIMLEKGIAKEQILSVLVSTSGIVNQETGCLNYCAMTPQWGNNIPIAEYLKPHFAPDTRILLDSATKMMAYPLLSEPRYKGKRVVALFTSWVIASCYISNDQIFSGKNSLFAELGHMVIDPNDTEKCGCGSYGCLERMVDKAHVEAVLAKNQADHPESPLLSIKKGTISIPIFFSFAQQGDPLARILVDYLAAQIAAALRNVAIVFDPEIVVIEGDYARSSGYFDTQLRRNLRQFRYFPTGDPFEIVYDTRDTVKMGIQGAYIAAALNYFNSPEHYVSREEPTLIG